MAQTMRTRPSILLAIQDPLVAYYFDRACWTFASTIEQEQNAAVNRLPKTAKDAAHTRARQRVLDEYLGVDSATQSQRFRSVGR